MARVCTVLVPANIRSEKASRTTPMPDSSRTSRSRKVSMNSRVRWRSFSLLSGQVRMIATGRHGKGSGHQGEQRSIMKP